MISSVESSLLLQTLLSFPNMFINKVAMMAQMEGICSLSHMYCHSPEMNWLQTLLSGQSASSNTNIDMAPFPRVASQLPGDRLITLACFHYESGSTLFLVKKILGLYIVLLYGYLLPVRAHRNVTYNNFL